MNFFCFLFFGLGCALFSRPSVHPCDQTLDGLGYRLFLCKHNLSSSDLFQNTRNRLLDLDPIDPNYSAEVVLDSHDSFPLAVLYHYFHFVDSVFLDYSLGNLLCIHLYLYILLSSLLGSTTWRLVCSLLSYSSYLLLHMTT